MPKPILPDNLRQMINSLSKEGYSTIEILDIVHDEVVQYVDSDEQLTRCIAGIASHSSIKKSQAQISPASSNIPPIKPFDAQKHAPVIATLREEMIPLEFERACEEIVVEILEDNEGFSDLENANNVDGFHNPPFDFFGCKDGQPYMIEFKGSLKYFHALGETKKRRLKEIKDQIKDVHMALIQVKLQKAEYRIFYDEEMDLFFDGKHMPCEPVVEWLRDRMKAKCPGS